MSSLNLQELASSRPEEREALERLERVLIKGKEYNFDRLMDLVRPKSENFLMLVLGELVRSGVLHLVYRVESPTMGGVQDFDKPENIPHTIHDWRTDREIPVTTDNVKLLFEVDAR